MKESAEFFGENAESFQSAEEALTLYHCFFVPSHNGVEHLLSKSLRRPTGIPQHTQQSTSVVVRFLSGDDVEYISGWSPFLLAWPTGKIAQARLATNNSSPPEVGQHEITKALSDDAFDGMFFGTDVDIDEGDVSILGDKYGIFQHKENLIKLVSLACGGGN